MAKGSKVKPEKIKKAPKVEVLEENISEELTPMQELFCQQFMVDLNATEAAKRAGFSKDSAGNQGSRLMKNVYISSRIKHLLAQKIGPIFKASDKVIRELEAISFADPRKVFDEFGALLPPSSWPDEIAGAIAAIEVNELYEYVDGQKVQIGYVKKIKFWDKNRSLENLGRYHKLFVDTVNVNVNVGLAERLTKASEYAAKEERRLLDECKRSGRDTSQDDSDDEA